ncbi:MAG: hypothetical protein NC418_09735 [Muribaculaceae bacterium]|nr:hypothetical protein [Muribaculaceae bacterium]
MKAAATIILAAALLAAACDSRPEGERSVPRRYAYPRTAELDTAVCLYGSGGLTLSMSRSAQVTSERTGWLTAAYPTLGATLYLSSTRPGSADALAAAVANRRQRISLNLGGATARTDALRTDAGFDCELVVCSDGVSTPVQFIATDGTLLVSGAFVLSGRTAPADSLRPIADSLEREAFSIVNSLCSE